MDIEKAKLPKGLSYALKTSMLEKALSESNITTYVHLIYSNSDIFFDATYWLPNENVSYYRFYIRAGHVQSNKRLDAQKYMQHTVIPEFIHWAKKIINLPDGSTKLLKESYFRRDFT